MDKHTTSAAALKAVAMMNFDGLATAHAQLGAENASRFDQACDHWLRLIAENAHGQVVDRADGYLLLFERPIEALSFALEVMRKLPGLNHEFGITLSAKIGIHVGDVVVWRSSPEQVALGAKPLHVEGLIKPIAARLMSLAMPNQILLSAMAQALCQRAQAELGDYAAGLLWRVHGRYRFKGIDAAMLVHEVGEPGVAPLLKPQSAKSAWRELPFWRRPPVLAVEVILAMALVAAGLAGWFNSEPVLAFAEHDWVVVADLQNLSGEPTYEGSIPTALKIGLSQSQHVSVMTPAHIIRGLRKMEVAPDSVLSRDIAKNVALREGAKALIVPTAANYAGKIRLSLEIVDPESGVTVYSKSIDAKNEADIFGALDRLLIDVRDVLGEPIEGINRTSKPLADVTTENLNALRAFSIGEGFRTRAMFADALSFLTVAADLDPQFAMAHQKIGLIHYASGNHELAVQKFVQALEYKERLTDRERLSVEASALLTTDPAAAADKLRVMLALHPQDYGAAMTISFIERQWLQQPAQAHEVIKAALVPQNPSLSHAYFHAAGSAALLGRVDEAKTYMIEADKLGVRGWVLEHANIFAIDRDYQRVEEIISRQDSVRMGADSVANHLHKVIYAMDRGQPQQAVAAAKDIASLFENSSVPVRQKAVVLGFAMRLYEPDAGLRAEIKSAALELMAALDSSNPLIRQAENALLYTYSWMLARLDEKTTSERLFAVASSYEDLAVYAENRHLRAIAKSEILIRGGNSAEAITVLEEAVNSGGESFATHAQLAHVLLSANQEDRARTELNWLVNNRGPAFMAGDLWSAVNVTEHNLAVFRLAKLTKKSEPVGLADGWNTPAAQAWAASQLSSP